MKFLTLILACVALAGCHAKKLSYRDPFYFGGKADTAKMHPNSPLGKLILMRSTHDQYAWAGTVDGQEKLNYNTIVNPSRSNYSFRQNNVTIIKISPPDSNRIITVTFSKSLVHFINDSTFTYKQK